VRQHRPLAAMGPVHQVPIADQVVTASKASVLLLISSPPAAPASRGAAQHLNLPITFFRILVGNSPIAKYATYSTISVLKRYC